jgi:hypothetical protein
MEEAAVEESELGEYALSLEGKQSKDYVIWAALYGSGLLMNIKVHTKALLCELTFM